MTAAATVPPYATRARPTALSTDWLYCGIATGALLLMYLLLQNPYWVPGGDSEVYTSIARNLLVGKHYTFNGQPVSMVPPGWPWFLAAAMKISPTFLLLKNLTMLCMLGSLSTSYFICRRYAPPAISLIAILLTGILSYVYQLTFWLHSDALFCLTSALSLLLALQINERPKSAYWRIALLVVLCGVNVMVRWAGLLTWLTVAAALLDGTYRPRLNRLWITLILSGAVTFATFGTLRRALRVDKATIAEMEKYGGQNMGEGSGDTGPAVIVKGTDNTVSKQYELFNPAAGGVRGIIGRFLGWGNWYSYLLWQPFRIGHANNLVGLFGQLVGWIVLGSLITIAIIRGRFFGQWIWAVILIYSLALAVNWPRPNARYLVPIAPLILLGVLLFFSWVAETYGARGGIKALNLGLLGGFVATLIICNGALYACDVWVARSSNQFYAKYEAGLESDLISAAKWLNDHNVGEGQVAVCQRYVNLGKIGNSWLGLRATSLLTNRAIVAVPSRYTKYGDPRSYDPFLAWARSPGINVKYVLFQPDVSPWRVFHFRMAWLQKAMTKQDVVDTGAGWRLYAIPEKGDAERISIKPTDGWPTRVPGL